MVMIRHARIALHLFVHGRTNFVKDGLVEEVNTCTCDARVFSRSQISFKVGHGLLTSVDRVRDERLWLLDVVTSLLSVGVDDDATEAVCRLARDLCERVHASMRQCSGIFTAALSSSP